MGDKQGGELVFTNEQNLRSRTYRAIPDQVKKTVHPATSFPVERELFLGLSSRLLVF